MAIDLSDYVDVRQRLTLALAQYPELRIVEDAPELITIGERVYIQAGVTIFRTPDDPLPGRAYCWEVWPGRTPYTKDSEQANAATSVLGRALGYMGFGITTAIASLNEVRTAQMNANPDGEQFEPYPHPSTQPKAQPRASVGANSKVGEWQTDTPARKADGPRGLATEGQLRLIATMRAERELEEIDTAGMTYADATAEIDLLKTIKRNR